MSRPCTPEQLQEAMDAYFIHGSEYAAATALSMARSKLSARLMNARARGFAPSGDAVEKRAQRVQAAAKASSPIRRPVEGFEVRSIATGLDEHGNTKAQWIGERLEGRVGETVPDGHIVKGLSTLLDESGKIRAQWVKTSLDDADFQKAVDAVCTARLTKVKPLGKIKAPRTMAADMLTQYTVTDYHVGMLAWGKETGAPWDLDIAERVLMNAIDQMVDAAPPSEIGLLAQLGDFLHFDSLKAITPEHGHLLDADSRYPKIVEVGTRVLEYCVVKMLGKHREVWAEFMEGNHDPAGSIWMRRFYSRIFQNNPRVKVGQSPRPYVAHLFGDTFLGYHHGHLTKNQNLPLLFAALFPQLWGQSKKRYIHTGHRHHVEEKEHPGIKVVQHSTLAAPDAYAARGGWLSERQIVSMTYHKLRGEIARGVFLPSE